MKNALVLSSGAAWTAYQIGALEYLTDERDLRFSLCAGTGMGAMNAAFVACGEFRVLRERWESMGWTQLVRPNWSHPWKDAPLVSSPQRRFIERYVSEQKLQTLGNRLIFSALELRTGEERLFAYPGDNVPLIDALMGAVALPGGTPPCKIDGKCFVEGTFVNTFVLNRVIEHYPADAYYAIANLPAGSDSTSEDRQYRNWRQVLMRTIQLNLSRDIRREISDAHQYFRSRKAYVEVVHYIRENANRVAEETSRTNTMLEEIEDNLDHSPSEKHGIPEFFPIVSSEGIKTPLWSFRSRWIRHLREMGYRDARDALSTPGEGGG